jgi:molybdopterin-containing oxidoreductase family membrane subunit
MVLTLAIPLRKWYHLEDLITMKHIDWMAKVMLTTGLIVFYGYILEMFYGMYSGNVYEQALVFNRLFGPYRWGYYGLIFCNGIAPQFLWSPAVRKNLFWLWIICQIVSVGMWLERYVIIPLSLTRDFLPSSWGYYTPSSWDWMMFAGTMGLFTFLMFLFIRFMPIINIFEMKDLLHRQNGHSHGHSEHGHGGHGKAEPVPVD